MKKCDECSPLVPPSLCPHQEQGRSPDTDRNLDFERLRRLVDQFDVMFPKSSILVQIICHHADLQYIKKSFQFVESSEHNHLGSVPIMIIEYMSDDVRKSMKVEDTPLGIVLMEFADRHRVEVKLYE